MGEETELSRFLGDHDPSLEYEKAFYEFPKAGADVLYDRKLLNVPDSKVCKKLLWKPINKGHFQYNRTHNLWPVVHAHPACNLLASGNLFLDTDILICTMLFILI